MARAPRHERGEVARSGSHLVHALVGANAELLQDARLDLRLHHRFAVAQGNLEVGEGEVAALRGDEILALQLEEEIEDLGIEHLPGSDLLLDHVEAGLLDVHGGSAMISATLGKGELYQRRLAFQSRVRW